MLTERSRGGIFIRNLGQAQIIFLTLTLSPSLSLWERVGVRAISKRQQPPTPTLF